MSKHQACPHCGCEIEVADKRRSVPQMRRYFAMIRAAYHHWPESHETQFASQEECRKWLQAKAGHVTIAARIPIVGIKPDRLVAIVEAAMRAAGSYAMIRVHNAELVVFVPRSIAFHRLNHLAACALFDEVAGVIETETGLKVEDLMRETERAA